MQVCSGARVHYVDARLVEVAGLEFSKCSVRREQHQEYGVRSVRRRVHAVSRGQLRTSKRTAERFLRARRRFRGAREQRSIRLANAAARQIEHGIVPNEATSGLSLPPRAVRHRRALRTRSRRLSLRRPSGPRGRARQRKVHRCALWEAFNARRRRGCRSRRSYALGRGLRLAGKRGRARMLRRAGCCAARRARRGAEAAHAPSRLTDATRLNTRDARMVRLSSAWRSGRSVGSRR